MKIQKRIETFRGNHYYLSNFFSVPVFYAGVSYQNNEAAFQAQKQPERAQEFASLPPNEAKHLGRRMKLRPDWESVKLTIMKEIVWTKFTQNEHLREKLLATGNAELIEGNHWHDNFYGICSCTRCLNNPDKKGANHLGRILMEIRNNQRIK